MPPTRPSRSPRYSAPKPFFNLRRVPKPLPRAPDHKANKVKLVLRGHHAQGMPVYSSAMDTWLTVKTTYAKHFRIAPQDIHLVWDGQQLRDKDTVAETIALYEEDFGDGEGLLIDVLDKP
ncbi:uncharacterized protein EHS24_004192 [Apiotrichum porosum]|uniref:Ubiquitin-like domain-containing protein n=1 Tax=Apiotrichum porosum TaxID=105984 RepID=A0A427Y4J6_9TREE|nr:uncharacterized protein EHS24_004192 [Apiotrichum porosum]RSH86002.1 hypothetical protein EHS24_004192 [Apiotrichum porosum]